MEHAPRIVALNASHRGDRGLTRALLDRISKEATAAGAECEILTLAKLKIQRYLSCYQCQDKDDVRMIFDHMAGADLLIFATHVYLMNMSGLLNTLLDRTYSTMDIKQVRLSNGLIHHHINPAISSKPFVTLVVCSNVEEESSRNVTAYFRTYARFMETRQVGVLVRNSSALFEHANEPELARDFPKTLDVFAAYEQAGQELATCGRIRSATQRKANQEVVPAPFFRLLKHLKPIKLQVLEYMRREMS